MEDEDAALIIRQWNIRSLGGIISQAAAGRDQIRLGQRIQILSESSEDDIMLREENDEDLIEEDKQSSMRGLMSIFSRNR